MPTRYSRIVQLYSDLGQDCPACEEPCFSGEDSDDWLMQQTNHLIDEHEWDVLHVGQQTYTTEDGAVLHRTVVVLAEPAKPAQKR